MVIEPVMSTVNFICSPGLDYHQFHGFLSEIETEYPELPCHIGLWWFRAGKVLLWFFLSSESWLKFFW